MTKSESFPSQEQAAALLATSIQNAISVFMRAKHDLRKAYYDAIIVLLGDTNATKAMSELGIRYTGNDINGFALGVNGYKADFTVILEEVLARVREVHAKNLSQDFAKSTIQVVDSTADIGAFLFEQGLSVSEISIIQPYHELTSNLRLAEAKLSQKLGGRDTYKLLSTRGSSCIVFESLDESKVYKVFNAPRDQSETQEEITTYAQNEYEMLKTFEQVGVSAKPIEFDDHPPQIIVMEKIDIKTHDLNEVPLSTRQKFFDRLFTVLSSNNLGINDGEFVVDSNNQVRLVDAGGAGKLKGGQTIQDVEADLIIRLLLN